MVADAITDETYEMLAIELSDLGLAYVHIFDHSALGAPPVPDTIKATLRRRFRGTVIAAGGFDGDKAEATLGSNLGDLVAFGRPFIANPTLVSKLRDATPLSAPDFATFYTAGAEGYTDYSS